MLAAISWSANELEEAGADTLRRKLDLTRPGFGGLATSSDNPEATYAELRNYFSSRPPVFLDNIDPPTDYASVAEDVLKGRFVFLGKPAVTFPLDVSWNEDPFNDHSWTWNLHAMRYLTALTQHYRDSQDLAYLQRAGDFVLDRIQGNSEDATTPKRNKLA